MNYKRYIAVFVFTVLVVICCQSQNQPVPPKIQHALDSLYPKAANTRWEDQPVNTTTRRVNFNCNCTEGNGYLRITFDVNGNIVNKDIDISEKDLPASVTNYIENNYPGSGFRYGETSKQTTNSGGYNYRVELLQTNPDGNVTDGGWIYILKFKASGEFISVDKRLQNN
ncbi:MAG TPA: hypothetical protein VK809_12055 [Bacteroidia bacterium]|jgi:hypothetical protein|nr:hypothetical protein [Bacteroidia bacterium]